MSTVAAGRPDDHGGSLYDLYGAGIENTGTLTLNHAIVSGNVTLNEGGGIDKPGHARADQFTISGNSARSVAASHNAGTLR